MLLNKYFEEKDGGICISASQASAFAKEVARDFNPLHDEDNKRFCVPGDLLFSMVLDKYGLSQNMHFVFSGMVGHDVILNFPVSDSTQIEITDLQGKSYLHFERSGEIQNNTNVIEALIRDYVAFSGHNFPYVLVPLLEQEKVMFNLDRPLVIYESMTLNFHRVDFSNPTLKMLAPEMAVNGKRATALLHFQIVEGDEVVGAGFKKLAVGGLREYEKEPLDAFVAEYLARKNGYLESDNH